MKKLMKKIYDKIEKAWNREDDNEWE